MPTLAEALAVRPEQLTNLTPAGVDRFNAVLWPEMARVKNEIEKARDGIHRALLQSKKSERRGRGYAQVWPTTFEDAERTARDHAKTGYEPDQMTRIQAGLYREGAYTQKLRAAIELLDSLRAQHRTLADGPAAVLDGEFDRRGGWTRMYLCTSDGGHIHTGRECPSIGPRTGLARTPG